VIIARMLGPHDKGIYNLILLLPSVYAVLLDLGFTNGTFLYLARGELEPGVAYTNSLAFVTAGLLVVALPVGLTVQLTLARMFPGVPQVWLLVAVLVLAPLGTHGAIVAGGLLQGTNRATSTFVLLLVPQLLTVAGAVPVLLLHGGLAGMVWVAVASTGITQVAYFLTYREGGRRLGALRLRQLGRVVRFGLPLYAATVFSFLHGRADQLLIGGRLPAGQLGQYALAVSLGEMLWNLDLPIVAAVQYDIASGSGEEADALVNRVSHLVVVAMSTACVLAAVSAPWGIPLVYGAAFGPAAGALLAYLPGVFCWSVARAVGLDLGYQRGRTDLVLYGNVLGFAVNFPLLLALLPRLGIVGASLASSVSYFVFSAFVIAVRCRLSASRVRDLVVPSAADVAWLMGRVRAAAGRAREA
jgi:O-antigen/teichoic acid export membrane protein